MSRLSMLGLLFSALSVQTVFADHWISVGSYKNRDAAEKGLLQARTKTSQPLSVVASEHSTGINYRVSAGPYATLGDAKKALPEVLDSGRSDAWIWQLKSFASVPNSGAQPLRRTELSSALADIDRLNFPAMDATLLPQRSSAIGSMGTSLSSAEVEDTSQQAPPGYQLHRLLRDN